MRGGAVVVIGSPGIGKSTLVEEFTRRARAQHVPVLAGRTADHDGAPAFWPWIRALSGDSAARLALSPVLLDVDPVGDAQIAAAVRFAAIARCAKALVTAGSGNGLIVTLEDMQWADDASIALFRYLCRDGPAAGLLILATTREPVPDGLAGLPDTALWRLQPFTRAEVAEYLGATAHPSWAREVHDRSAGLPLLVREIAATLGETRLAAPSGPAPCLPTGLGPVFDLRAGRLSPQCRMLLDGASALDDDADVALLDARPGALAQALGTGFVRQDAEVPGRLQWSHELLRQAWYAGLGADERVRHHGRIADALESAPDVDLDRAARHRVLAVHDDASRRSARRACLTSAAAARGRSDFAAASYWLESSIPLLSDDLDRATTCLALAEAAYHSGQVASALARCQDVADLAERLGRVDLLAEAAVVVRGVGGVPLEALLALCDRADAALEGEDSSRHARVLAEKARLLADALRVEAAEPVAQRALAMAEAGDDPVVLMAAIHARHEVVGGLDGLEERLTLAARMQALAARTDRVDAEFWAHVWRVDALFQTGATSDLHAELFDLAVVVERLGWPMVRWHLLRAQATRNTQVGRFEEAARLADECRRLAGASEDHAMRVQSDLLFMELHTLTGRFAERLVDAPPWEPSGQWMPVSASVAGWHAMAAGDLDAAWLMYHRARPELFALPVNQRWMPTLMRAADLAIAFDDREVIELVHRLLLPYEALYGGQSAAYLGAIARVLCSLAVPLGDSDRAVDHGARAVAAEQRVGAVPFVALAQLAHARALVARGRSGDRDRALGVAEDGLATARRLGLAPTQKAASALVGELTGARPGAGSLTRREREIVGLLEAGMSNAQIARQLVLSERTVEKHVQNMLAKLGLANRTQIAGWALRTGIRTEGA